MAEQDRRQAYAVALQREPYKFDFFQTLRRLECLHRSKPRLGESLRASDDPVRLAQEPSMRFAPSTLASFEPGTDGRPPRLAVFFLGLLGPNGPLPLHLTEHASDRLRNAKDFTFARFLDIFHHRILALFYHAWAVVQPCVHLDRPEFDRFAVYVGSLFGIGMPSFRNRDAMPDLAKLHHAGLLACPTGHPDGLGAILRSFFKLPVAIEEFVGQWMTVPGEYRWRLGESPDTGALGVTTIVGSRMWECQQKFRIVLGPVGFVDYQRMLPGGDALPRLVALVLNYCPDELAWDLKLVLKKEEVPRLQLGMMGQLGWTSWLPRQRLDEDVDDRAGSRII